MKDDYAISSLKNLFTFECTAFLIVGMMISHTNSYSGAFVILCSDKMKKKNDFVRVYDV